MLPGRSTDKVYWLSCAAAVAAAVALGWAFIAASAPTYDEPVHLASGYLGLTAGKPINYRDHPPLGEMWAALPLLRLPLSQLRQSVQWGRLYNYSDVFLYMNLAPAERILNSARRWCLVSWSVLLFPAVLAWAAEAGTAALAAAAVLCAFCPPLLSNLALVTTDGPAAVLFFLTFWLASRRPASRWTWAAAGAALGFCLAAKFSMIVVPGLLAAVLLTEGRLTKRRPIDAAGAVVLTGAAFLALAAVYRFKDLPLYWEGLNATLARLGEGRSTFVAGRYSRTGSWLYFPAGLALKTPLPLLLTAGLGLALRARKAEASTAWLVLPPAALFLAACGSKTQIGYRYILPVYPFLLVLGAQGAAGLWGRARWGRACVLLLGVWLAAGVLRVHPDYLAYFNEAAGGPDAGYRWLVDSNLDWGQGLRELGEELKRRGSPHIFLSYFGVADPSYYGIRYTPAGFVSNVDRRDGAAAPPASGPVLLAISATNLQGVYYSERASFAWLKERRPIFAAGHSIFLYDLTGDAEARARLGALLGQDAAKGR